MIEVIKDFMLKFVNTSIKPLPGNQGKFWLMVACYGHLWCFPSKQMWSFYIAVMFPMVHISSH
jgi:hypothetical protein